jgi:hypothetical protein
MLYRTQFESSSRKVHLRAQLLVIVVRCVVQFEITSSEPFFLDIPSTQHFHYEAFHALHKSICHYVKTILQSEPTFESFVFLFLICGVKPSLWLVSFHFHFHLLFIFALCKWCGFPSIVQCIFLMCLNLR